MLQTHNLHQSAQRITEALIRQEAWNDPNKLLCISIDGMTQRTTESPKLAALSAVKELNGDGARVTFHLISVLAYGFSEQPMICGVFKDLPHDSNMICSCLLQVLLKIKETKGFLSKELFVIADNTTRENKNHTVLSWLALLVATRVFEKTSIGFLMVGHTHGKNDQVHSRIST